MADVKVTQGQNSIYSIYQDGKSKVITNLNSGDEYYFNVDEQNALLQIIEWGQENIDE